MIRLSCLSARSIFVLSFFLSQSAFAFGAKSFQQEPAYCSPSGMAEHEIRYTHEGIVRQHAYRFGDLILVGVAVGESTTSDVIEMAEDFSNARETENYCTWYFGNLNPAALETFNDHYVPRPAKDPFRAAKDFRSGLAGIFGVNPINMLECARDHHYIAMGCDGMAHRGPTALGMLLAYTGCQPEHAYEIVTALWGLNGLNPASRYAAIREGSELAKKQPEQAAELRALFER